MATRIVPASRRDWVEELGLQNAKEGQLAVLQSALMVVAVNLRPGIGDKAKHVTVSQMKRYYGKILWTYLGEYPPTLNPENISLELGQVYFAYILRKILEAKPIVTRE